MHVGIAEQCEMRVNALSDESIRQDVVKVPVATTSLRRSSPIHTN